jgi:hypothetical protein
MDLAQAFIFDLGWVFFAAWGMVLAAVSVIVFGRDVIPSTNHKPVHADTVGLTAKPSA